jgi:putative copper export protein
VLLSGPPTANRVAQVHAGLRRFSALGVPLVAILVLSGLVNSWYLVGAAHLGRLSFEPYGPLLILKLLALVAMLLLAAINRYRLTPALQAPPAGASIGSLRRSIALETLLGLLTLSLVAWLGRSSRSPRRHSNRHRWKPEAAAPVIDGCQRCRNRAIGLISVKTRRLRPEHPCQPE